MQFEINKEILVKALSNVNGAVEKRNTIPVLLNVKIEAKDGKLNLTATDMDIVVTCVADALINKEGITTVPAQLFFDIIKKIPDNAAISGELSGHSLKIKYGKSKFSLPCLDASEFPALSEGDMTTEFTVKTTQLSRIIDKTRFAISNDETRYYLNGLFLHAVENKGKIELRGVATDGHRLALFSSTDSSLKAPIDGVIIPRKTVNEIRRIIEGSEEVEILLSKAKIKVVSGDSIIISKLIDGEFPEYDKVIPKGNDRIINVDKKVIFDAVDRVSTIANDKNRSIKFSLDSGKISLQVSTSDGGLADEEIDIDFTGEKIESGFNSRYLLEIINQVDRDKFSIKFKDSASPALIDNEETSDLYVIMPVRI